MIEGKTEYKEKLSDAEYEERKRKILSKLKMITSQKSQIIHTQSPEEQSSGNKKYKHVLEQPVPSPFKRLMTRSEAILTI